MKKLYFLLVTLLVTSLSIGQDLLITAAYDGPLPGGLPKGIELYVVNDIPDLSIYAIGSANNGGGTDGEEFTFPADAVTAGTYLLIGSEDVEFTNWFGSAPDYNAGSAMGINGDDAVELFQNGVVIDVFGDINVDGNGTPWEYLDGWAYRVDGTGPDGSTFVLSNWFFSGPNALDNETSNSTAVNPIPVGTYSAMVNMDPTVNITFPFNGDSFDSGTTSVDVEWSVENAPSGATVNISITANGGAPVVTNDASSPFTISPTADGDTYSVSVELVDGGLLDSDTVDFIIAYPCDLQVGTITENCNGTTYDVTIDYTGGATSQYLVDTGGIGTLGGDDPDSVADGTITITDIPEGTDFTVIFTGNSANSSCNFTRNINSPNCLPLPQYDTFTYADGPLIGNGAWDVTGTSNSDDLLVTSGQALVQHGAPSQDVNLPFASVTGDLFYAFDMTVPALAAPIGDGGGTDFEYFAHFKDGGFGFSARLDIVPPSGAGDYSVGIATTGGSADATWATDLTYGATYRITVRYDQVANFAELWVDAAAETDTSILGADEADMDADTIEAFGFRQSDSSDNEGILVDNLAITETFAETLSTDDFTIASGFKVYPNPTSLGFVNIVSANNETISVAVYDILGKEVINNTLTNNRLNVSALNSGVYIMKVTQNNASVTKKLIIK